MHLYLSYAGEHWTQEGENLLAGIKTRGHSVKFTGENRA
jgi:hypothetical protein